MKDIQIRDITPDDMTEIDRLIKTRDDLDEKSAPVRTELMEWLVFHNPFAIAHGETTYFVAESPEGIMAYHGRMPVEFMIDGKPVKSYFIHDLYVDPAYRKKGMGFWMTRAIAKHIEKQSSAFFCIFGMTPLNLEMHRRFKYYETATTGFAKPLNPHREIMRVVKTGWLASLLTPFVKYPLHLLDSTNLGLRSIGVKTEKITKFSPEFETFNQSIAKKVGICTHKTTAYLNWKYIDRPYPRETVFAARKGGKLSGYVIVCRTPYKKHGNLGIIIDLMADPDDTKTVAALIKVATKFCRRQKMHSVRCSFTHPAFQRLLKKMLFFKTDGKAVMLGNLEKSDIDEVIVKDIKNWHFTLGESDTYMLSP